MTLTRRSPRSLAPAQSHRGACHSHAARTAFSPELLAPGQKRIPTFGVPHTASKNSVLFFGTSKGASRYPVFRRLCRPDSCRCRSGAFKDMLSFSFAVSAGSSGGSQSSQSCSVLFLFLLGITELVGRLARRAHYSRQVLLFLPLYRANYMHVGTLLSHDV